MSNYYLALERPLFVISFEEIMKSLGSSVHHLKGRNPYHLETIDSFTKLFPGPEELYHFLKVRQLIPDGIQERKFMIVEVSEQLHMDHLKVCYNRTENLFCIETLMVAIEKLYHREDTHIAYTIGWEIRKLALMKPRQELSKEELLKVCREYVCSSNGKVDYIKLRKLAMIVDRVQLELKGIRPESKLTYQPHWINE